MAGTNEVGREMEHYGLVPRSCHLPGRQLAAPRCYSPAVNRSTPPLGNYDEYAVGSSVRAAKSAPHECRTDDS
jgi:hypothetical protein